MQSHPKSVELDEPAAEQTHATLPYPLGPTTSLRGNKL